MIHKKYKHHILLYLVFLFFACSESDEYPTLSVQEGRQVLVYMVADNNLDYFALDDINEMEEGLLNSSNPTGELLVLIDRNENGSPMHPYLLRIVPDNTNEIVSNIIKVYPELNSSNPEFFSDVLLDIENFTETPFESKGLVMWSHGNAWLPPGISLYSDRDIILDDSSLSDKVKSFGLDENTNGSGYYEEMDVIELADVLSNYKFDFIVFDACFMGAIEVLYEFKDVADYIISSPTEILSEGFPYDRIVKDLLSVDFNAESVAQHKMDFYNGQQGVLNSSSVSVVKTENLESLSTFFKEKLSNSMGVLNMDNIALSDLQQFDRLSVEYLFDMHGFVNGAIVDDEMKEEFNTIWEDVVIMSDHTEYIFGSLSLENCNGVSMYIPQNYETRKSIDEYYKNYKWYTDSNLGILFDF